MYTVAVISRKGGTGKTTLAVHLAVAAVRAGYVTVVVDLDSQTSATEWYDIRKETYTEPTVVSVHANRLKQVIYAAKENGAEFVIIDTSSKTGDDPEAAVAVADLALIPCRPSMFDLNAISLTVKVANNAKIPAHIVFNAVDARSIILPSAKRSLEVFDAKRVPCMMGDRVAFKYPIVDGQTAQEFDPNSKASDELNALFKYLVRELKEIHRETTDE